MAGPAEVAEWIAAMYLSEWEVHPETLLCGVVEARDGEYSVLESRHINQRDVLKRSFGPPRRQISAVRLKRRDMISWEAHTHWRLEGKSRLREDRRRILFSALVGAALRATLIIPAPY